MIFFYQDSNLGKQFPGFLVQLIFAVEQSNKKMIPVFYQQTILMPEGKAGCPTNNFQ